MLYQYMTAEDEDMYRFIFRILYLQIKNNTFNSFGYLYTLSKNILCTISERITLRLHPFLILKCIIFHFVNISMMQSHNIAHMIKTAGLKLTMAEIFSSKTYSIHIYLSVSSFFLFWVLRQFFSFTYYYQTETGRN